jgi:hypothetical protein
MKQRTKRNNAKLIKFNLRNRISWRGKQLRIQRKHYTEWEARAGYTATGSATVDTVHGE